ncbi:hypothetical protein KIH74_18110 [Kineosporia sp. J2-2]|uniref:Uncharacterized protein n=1 Tax=Kineosporia corallincola TaxID=2835133 RepID=A0ABS5TLE2_9ACTN|nr:hypothetical protein [Kineosporia corallincola]MBT0770863.1 hypothetical protein [Kineosporia corallincola]
MLKAVGEAFVVVGAGARLWLRHWPVLLTIALFALAGRMGAIWLAVRVSEVQNTLGVLVVVLAPLCAVTGIVLMLYTLRHSLPTIHEASTAAGPEDRVRHRERRLLDILASVLVPFLAVYASYGFLRQDIDRYTNAIFGEEFTSEAIFAGMRDANLDRFGFAEGWQLVAIVVVAVALKFGLAKLEAHRAWAGFGFLGAYVEVLWLATIAIHLTTWKDSAWDWAESRRGVEMFVEGWEALLDRLGPFADAADIAGAWALDLVSSVDSLVIVPIAWLTVGAVVYGHRLVEPPPVREPRLLRAVPGPVRRAGTELTGEIAERFSGLFGGLRQLAVAGLGPMLIFALAFLASQRLEDALNELTRWIIGPQTAGTWLAFSPHVQTVTRAVGLTVTMCLLAAAVERVLAKGGAVIEEEHTDDAGEPEEAQPQPA